MSKVIDMLGITEKVEEVVAARLQKGFISLPQIRDLVKKSVDSLSADVYSNMKEIDQQKYKLVELGIQISNLTELVKMLQARGGD